MTDKRPSREIRVLTDEELKAFMRAAEKAGAKDDALFHLTFYFALRVGEVAALPLSSLNTTARPERQIYITRLKNGLPRSFDIPDWLWKKIAKWLRLRQPASSPYLFPHRSLAGHASREGIQCAFKALAKRAGIERMVSVHDLRHTMATVLAESGDGLKDVAGWLGHASLTSSQHYIDRRISHEHEQKVKSLFLKGV